MSVGWNPWHGCRKISEGCRHCYVYRQDERHDKDSSEVRKTSAFNLPVRRSRDGRFKVPAGEMVYTCFTSDFLLEEADAWRAEAWEMMRIRHDLRFLFFTKRIDRLAAVLPPDWGDGYENVVIGCTVENQAMADYRLLLFLATPVRHRLIVCAPLLGPLDIARYLSPAVTEIGAEVLAFPLEDVSALAARAKAARSAASNRLRSDSSRPSCWRVACRLPLTDG